MRQPVTDQQVADAADRVFELETKHARDSFTLSILDRHGNGSAECIAAADKVRAELAALTIELDQATRTWHELMDRRQLELRCPRRVLGLDRDDIKGRS